MPPVRVKICGLRSEADVASAVEAGASYLGFTFIEKSKRAVTPEIARDLAVTVPPGVCKVALTYNIEDPALDAILDTVPIDMIQLHGSEPPERVAEIRARTGLPAMKAIGIGAAEDLEKIPPYEAVADQILLDTKPPANADLPGGNGLAFDWTLAAGRDWAKPWMLAGGLTPETVADAIRISGTQQVDVASGVESAPGVKDADLIAAFIRAAT